MPTAVQVMNRATPDRPVRVFTGRVESVGPPLTVSLDGGGDTTNAEIADGHVYGVGDRVLLLVTPIGNWVVGGLSPFPRPLLTLADPAEFVAQSGWGSITAAGRRYDYGNGVVLAYQQVIATRTGAPIAAGATGNFADSAVCTFPASLTPAERMYFSFSGGMFGDGYLTTGGQVVLAAGSPNQTLATGAVVNLNLMYPAV